MGGSSSREEAAGPEPEDEMDEGLAVGDGALQIRVTEAAPPEEEDGDDWDLDLDGGEAPLRLGATPPPGQAAVAFVVEDSSKIVMRDKPDASAPEHPHIPAPPDGALVSGVIYAINSQDWVQLEEPCKGFWIQRDGLKQR